MTRVARPACPTGGRTWVHPGWTSRPGHTAVSPVSDAEADMTGDEPESYTLEQAAESLDVSADDIRAYIDEGLVTPKAGPAGPVLMRGDMRRLWSAVTLHRDLGINLPGVAAVLQLREQYERVRYDLATLVEIVERELGPDVWDRLWPEGRPPPQASVSVEGVSDLGGAAELADAGPAEGQEAGASGDASGSEHPEGEGGTAT